ncbi:uncharacterized protein LOC111018564 isoform X2 [Momordica charantia]|uniref:Uncharacterized protein LOC111018564 isoform X2 n=1 Tax=Momordica charantia TaxID=3673 RepID=A0A6J1D8C2_MOMCH|nr:uncharacterized protein LOC111018564 isoform X2 [Momordica charantia]
MLSHRSKFHPRVIPYVFVGYPLGVKGYRLFDIEHIKFFLSRDVVFHEQIFPFSSISLPTDSVDPFPDFVLPKAFDFVSSPSGVSSLPHNASNLHSPAVDVTPTNAWTHDMASPIHNATTAYVSLRILLYHLLLILRLLLCRLLLCLLIPGFNSQFLLFLQHLFAGHRGILGPHLILRIITVICLLLLLCPLFSLGILCRRSFHSLVGVTPCTVSYKPWKPTTLGLLFLCPLVIIPSVVNGCTKSNTILMVLLIVIKHDLLLKGTLNRKALIISRLFHHLRSLLVLRFCSQ